MPQVIALLVLVSFLSQASSRTPAAQPVPGIPEALRIQPQDPAGAAKILEAVTAREPGNVQAWRLGAALQQAKQFDQAIEAYRKALGIQPDPATMYNLGTAYARKNEPDPAFEWLAKAKATRRLDMTQMEVDPDLEALRKDARYAPLLPKREDFDNPFVERRGSAEWDGEGTNHQFGWVARAVGDVDKNGVIDFVTSAPFKGAAGSPSGRVYAYSTRTRKLLWKVDGAAGDQLGTTLEAAGDVNADGIPDVVATGGSKAYVYSGNKGSVLLTLSSPGPCRSVRARRRVM
ncbi:MAG: tetratricopeptide repeat protein [Acidobacteria bacterium]|nr:tetratricopeptide repeat protein [Acidobacteriota bacterium]